jgi:hypothetical protein
MNAYASLAKNSLNIDSKSRKLASHGTRTIQRSCTVMVVNAFWDVMPCNLVGMYRHFCGTYCPYLITLRMEAAGSSKILVPTYQITVEPIAPILLP